MYSSRRARSESERGRGDLFRREVSISIVNNPVISALLEYEVWLCQDLTSRVVCSKTRVVCLSWIGGTAGEWKIALKVPLCSETESETECLDTGTKQIPGQ